MRQGRYRPAIQCKPRQSRRPGQPRRAAHADIRALDPRGARSRARLEPDGRDPITFQGLNPQGPEGQFGYTLPDLS